MICDQAQGHHHRTELQCHRTFHALAGKYHASVFDGQQDGTFLKESCKARTDIHNGGRYIHNNAHMVVDGSQ